jgi:hypothetical protein
MADPSDPSQPWWSGIPGSANLAERQPGLFGGPGANLVQVPVPGTDRTVTVNKAAADSFRGFLGNLADLGYPLTSVGGYSNRRKAGGGGLSEHAFGNAIDINPADNPWRTSKTNLPPNVSELAAKWGLTWGGDWSPANRDPMHFEWAGVNPISGVDYRSGKAVQLAGGDMPSKSQPQVNLQEAIFGPAPKTAAAAPPAQPPPAQAIPASETGDLQTHIFGPPPSPTTTPASSPAPTESDNAPLTLGGEPAATAVPAPAAQPPGWLARQFTLDKPSSDNWLQRDYSPSFAAMDNPLLRSEHPAFELPTLQEAGSGLGQGVRTVGTTLENIDKYLTENVPLYAEMNRLRGYTPEKSAAVRADLAAQTEAYKEQYKGSPYAKAGEIGGEILGTLPVGGVGGLVGRAVGPVADVALPMFKGAAKPIADWATTSGFQNMLTGGGLDPSQWAHDFASGALGGGLLGGAVSGTGALVSQATNAVKQEAENLGFKLSAGELMGGLAKKLESYTQYLPFSGAATKEAADKANISRILTRNMGIPETNAIGLGTIKMARANAGQLMDKIQQVTVDPNVDKTFFDTLANLHSSATANEVKPITNLIDHIQNVMANNGGKLPGDQLHNLISYNSDLDRLINTGDRAQSSYAQEVRNALQDAASRTADPALYPGATAATKQAVDDFNRGRYFWKVIKTVEPLVVRTGDAADASYTALANRIQGTAKNPNFDPLFRGGNGELDALARVLHGPLQDLKSSGTGRELAMARMLGLGEGAGAVGLGFMNPDQLQHFLQYVVAPTIAIGQAGRVSRLGLHPAENALLRRLGGPYLGNLLMGPSQQNAPNPAALQ